MIKATQAHVGRIWSLCVRWRHHERWKFTWDAGLLFIGNGFASLLFLVFHMLSGRQMQGEDYAEFVAMIGLLNVLSVPAGVMQLTMARYVAEQHQTDSGEAWLLIIRRGLVAVTRLGLFALLVWVVLSPMLRAFLKASSTLSVLMVGVIAFVFLYTPILGDALQGRHRFGWFAMSGIGVAISRLVLVLPVLYFSGSVPAVLAVVAVSFVVGLLISSWPLRGFRSAEEVPLLFSSRDIQHYFWGVLLSQTALFSLIHADLILSPRLFEGEMLAAYGKAATLSRIVFFLPIPIITAMFPRAVTSNKPSVIIIPLLLTLAMSLAAASALTLFPALPMQIMYGVSDPLHLALMRRYVWAVMPLALISILSPYLWARREVRLTLLIIPVVLGYLAILFHIDLAAGQVILCMFVAGLVTLALLLWLTVRLCRATENEAKGPSRT